MLARDAVLLTHSVSPPLDIPILELTSLHPVKYNSPYFMCLREPILQPLCFQIYPGMGGCTPSSSMGSVRPELPPIALSTLPATLTTFPASIANKRLTVRAKSFSCNTYKKQGRGIRLTADLLISTFRPSDVQTFRRPRPVPNRTDDCTPLIYIGAVLSCLSLRSADRPFLPPGGCHE